MHLDLHRGPRRRPRAAAATGLATRLATAALALALTAAAPGTAGAAVTTFGANLTTPATLDTASGLGYVGTNIAVPPSPTAPTGVVHIAHDGADTALWNAGASAPAAGQITSVLLEGCARPAAGGPSPLTQIHFQDLAPLGGGGAKVNVSSNPFNIPVCGQPVAGGGIASGSTVTTFQPDNLCVNQGDYVDLNDEGGFDNTYYPSGVPYMVMGVLAGATTDSFLRNDGTGNGAVMLATDTTNHDGFAANVGQELMLSATLATGPDATPLCPGGSRGVKAPPPAAGQPGGPPAMGLHPQRDGVNHARFTSLAMFCNTQGTPCTGTVTVSAAFTNAASVQVVATAPLDLQPQTPDKVQVRVTPQTVAAIRAHHKALTATLTVALASGPTYTQAITLYV